MKFIKIVLVFLSPVLLSGCAGFFGKNIDKNNIYSMQKELPKKITTINIKIDNLRFQKLLKDKTVQLPRIVSVFVTGGQPPMYRIFDIAENSTFSLMGLKNVDMLLSVNDRVIRNSDLLYLLPSYLPKDKKVEILIHRNGEFRLLKIEIR